MSSSCVGEGLPGSVVVVLPGGLVVVGVGVGLVVGRGRPKLTSTQYALPILMPLQSASTPGF
jgi:hypothetical protein